MSNTLVNSKNSRSFNYLINQSFNNYMTNRLITSKINYSINQLFNNWLRKTLFVITAALCFSITLYSQDIITMKNGDEIKAKIVEVSISEVKYKKFDNLQGTTYTVDKSNIFRIKYEDGSKDVFNKTSSQSQTNPQSNQSQNQQYEPAQDVTNIRVKQKDELLIVTYDLSLKADIEAYVSLDNGVTYKGPLQHVTGAVGKNISEGKDKIFLWDAKKEVGYVDVSAKIKIVTFTVEEEYITFCDIDILLSDLPGRYDWINAKRSCPEGWRLPTSEELKCIYMNKGHIGGFNGKQYWTSEEKKHNKAITRTFNDGKVEIEDMTDKYSVRCVRTHR